MSLWNPGRSPRSLFNEEARRLRRMKRPPPTPASAGGALAEDAAHESHRDFRSGPAQERLRQRVRTDRRRFPRVLRLCLWSSLGLLGVVGLLIAGLALLDPTLL